MTCKHCGGNHPSEACNIEKWAKYLTGESDEAPEGRTLIVAEEDELVDAIEEAHALKHIKSVAKSGGKPE